METVPIAPCDTTYIVSDAVNMMFVKPMVNEIAMPRIEIMLVKIFFYLKHTLLHVIISWLRTIIITKN
jgi:hypothetical protein